MTAGADGKIIDSMSIGRIREIITSLKDHSYPARRVYIEKKNSTKKRPLGIPSANDKLMESRIHREVSVRFGRELRQNLP